MCSLASCRTERLVPDVASTTLASGVAIPRIGLGTWPMDDAEAERAVIDAVTAGYRLFDTAENYRNERGVGRGLRASGIPREELFVTTKFNREWHGEELVRQAFGLSADRLGVDYVDLLLIHWPNPAHDRYVDAWRGMIRLREEGLGALLGQTAAFFGSPGPPPRSSLTLSSESLIVVVITCAIYVCCSLPR